MAKLGSPGLPGLLCSLTGTLSEAVLCAVLRHGGKPEADGAPRSETAAWGMWVPGVVEAMPTKTQFPWPGPAIPEK